MTIGGHDNAIRRTKAKAGHTFESDFLKMVNPLTGGADMAPDGNITTGSNDR
jgi:hypothetical protein